MAGLAGPSPPAPRPQTVDRGDIKRTGVHRRIDRLHARRRLHAVGDQISPDRHRGPAQPQLGGDPVPQPAERFKATRAGPAPRPFGLAIRGGGPVPVTAPAAGDLPRDRGRVTPDTTGDHRPRHITILDQRDTDLLAFGQQQRRAWHPVISNGRWWSTAPVIMTGTVHRPLELAVGAFPICNCGCRECNQTLWSTANLVARGHPTAWDMGTQGSRMAA